MRFGALAMGMTAAWLVACSPADAAKDDKKPAPDGCHPAAVREDGGCCPVGSFYAFDTDSCEAVGPPECATLVIASPASCQPVWCWDAKKESARRCSDGEVAAAKGCKAGHVVRNGGKECTPAGHFPGSGIGADWDPEADEAPSVSDSAGPWPARGDLPTVDEKAP